MSQIWDRSKWTKEKIIKEVFSLFFILLGVFSFRSSFFEPYVVPTGSMKPNILPGDRLIVSKMAYGLRFPFTDWVLLSQDEPKRGDVVVFKYPRDPDIFYIKRLIGLPGDKIEMDEQKLYINGELVQDTDLPELKMEETNNDEHQLLEEVLGSKKFVIQYDREIPFRPGVSVEVPKDHYFFMGDNRDNSSDSRVWGFVPREYIRGKALMIWMSFNTEESFLPKLRLKRIGNRF